MQIVTCYSWQAVDIVLCVCMQSKGRMDALFVSLFVFLVWTYIELSSLSQLYRKACSQYCHRQNNIESRMKSCEKHSLSSLTNKAHLCICCYLCTFIPNIALSTFCLLCSEKLSRELGDDKKCFLPVSTFWSLLSFLPHGRGDPLGWECYSCTSALRSCIDAFLLCSLSCNDALCGLLAK